jgi:hypothetical protein
MGIAMNTVRDIVKQSRRLGIDCTERTFWKYHKLGLLPKGCKIPGRGNKVYFPTETAVRIWLIHLLTKKMDFSLSDVSRYPWSQFEVGETICSPNALPGKFVMEVRNRCDKGKDSLLRQLVEIAVRYLISGGESVPVV